MSSHSPNHMQRYTLYLPFLFFFLFSACSGATATDPATSATDQLPIPHPRPMPPPLRPTLLPATPPGPPPSTGKTSPARASTGFNNAMPPTRSRSAMPMTKPYSSISSTPRAAPMMPNSPTPSGSACPIGKEQNISIVPHRITTNMASPSISCPTMRTPTAITRPIST